MTSKPNIERFIKTLLLQDKNYLTMAELGVHPKIKEQFLQRSIHSVLDEIDFWYKAGYDYVKLQPIADFNPDKIGLSDTTRVSDSGTLTYNWATEGQGIISNFSDLEKYCFPSNNDFDYSRFEKAKNHLPEGLGIIGQYGDIFTLTWEMMGFEGFSMALFEHPDLISQLNNQIGALVLSMFEYFAQCETIDVLWYSDDIAFSNALLMSPDVLHQYFFPWLKKIGDLAKQYNKPLIYHSDGVLWDVFDDIISCGVHAIHPIEPKAMILTEVQQKVGNNLCLIGHVDVDLLARGTATEIKNAIIKNIEETKSTGGYIVGSGNSIPDYIPFENYITLIETVKELKENF